MEKPNNPHPGLPGLTHPGNDVNIKQVMKNLKQKGWRMTERSGGFPETSKLEARSRVENHNLNFSLPDNRKLKNQ